MTTYRIAAMLAALALAGASGAGRQDGGQSARLSLDEARAYMVVLINRDRATAGLAPVTLDAVATAAGQKHATEMAARQYLAHWDMAGELPDERYTAEGGTGCVQENVYLRAGYRGAEPSGTLIAEPAPTFTRAEVEAIEASYFNERPPNDGHRVNILNPYHNRVGIGLARAAGDSGTALANAQEFVNRYVEAEPLPREASVGRSLVLAGRVLAGVRFRAVSVGRAPLPDPRTVAELRRTRSYRPPSSFAEVQSGDAGGMGTVLVEPDGRFRASVALSDDGRPGVYYLSIWVTGASGRDFIASRRTVLVR